MAYDSQRDTLYWTVNGNPIQLQQLSPGSDVSSNLVEVNSTAGMAVDYIGQRMYWVEGSTLVCIYSEVTNSTMTTNFYLVFCSHNLLLLPVSSVVVTTMCNNHW